MEVQGDSDRAIAVEDEVLETGDRPVVSACETSPGRTVFTEKGNSDAWIATDLTVSPSQ